MNKNFRYYIRVTSKNEPVLTSLVKRRSKPSGNWKDVSSCLAGCCEGIETTLQTPQNFVSSDGATGVINLSWDAVSGASNYRLERATNSTFTSGLASVFYGPATSYSNTGLTTGTTYYYRLSAIGANTSDFNTLSHVAP